MGTVNNSGVCYFFLLLSVNSQQQQQNMECADIRVVDRTVAMGTVNKQQYMACVDMCECK